MFNNFNNDKINNLINEMNEERTQLFNKLKEEKEDNKYLLLKIKLLENISRQLITYKKILVKEKNEK